jgi:DNA polymerase III sliding clamp (beta) subunit (PCNA family)
MDKAMKLTAEREKLLAPLQAVIGVVERRQTMPVLANVLLGAREGKLSITATDLEVELVASTRGAVQQAATSRFRAASYWIFCARCPRSSRYR